MSVIIKRINNLGVNDYERMSIKQKGDDYLVAIKGKNKYTTVATNCRIFDELIGATDKEQVKRLIEYFLEYSRINCLTDMEVDPHYGFRFDTAKGTRQLELQMNKKYHGDIYKMVIDKYLNDRLLFISGMKSISYYEFCCDDEKTSYEFKENGAEPCIRFNLAKDNDKLLTFEREFLENFISDILENTGEKATVGRRKQKDSNSRYVSTDEVYFTCGDVQIKLFKDATVITAVQKMVHNHNKTIDMSKAKQYKLEGF